MNKVKEYAKKASEFVKESYYKHVTDGYEEYVLPLVNGIVVRFWYGNCGVVDGMVWERGFNIEIYDHHRSVHMNGIDEQHLKDLLPYVEVNVEVFYGDYIAECTDDHNPISLPGCPTLQWSNGKHQYYIQRYDRYKGLWKEWIDDAWDYACKEAKNGRFWMGA